MDTQPPVPSNLPTSSQPPQGVVTPPAPAEKPKNASYGALISIIVILAVIVVGAFYSWGKRIEQNGQVIQLPDATTTEPAQ